ncbi:hypothetical protein D9619_003182 [Psilocybe cf. subviscida]|uniref:Glucose-6-phosphate 1-epimerase n=1 Tax=Psilocybe cf. subviscida TaxID=2480587 RepID=A0A8H5EV21_9AGAR|nr:hypothetical protein D9619_003182 [Psilocybe cf. subviscida]
MPVDHSDSKVTLNHPKGSTVEILLYGATIISWKVADKQGSLQERLFVSSKASLDGSKPVRGGIPVVFPCFGAPTHPDHLKLPQHGLARNQNWSFDSIVMDNSAGVSVRLTLDSSANPKNASLYPKEFRLAYVVTLAEHQLSTDLHVENPSATETIDFQALLHTYVRAPADNVFVTPLHGLSYFDKTEATDEARATAKTETRQEVDVKNFTDSVYQGAPGQYRVTWPGGSLEIRAKEFKDVVVWNPQEEGRKMSDMEADGWKNYVCVEPGYVRGFVTLEPKKSWIGQQVLTVGQD